MITVTKQQQEMAAYLHAVTDFCVRRGQSTGQMFVGNTRDQIFRYVSFCHFTGRLQCRVEDNKPTAVIICWPEFAERIEAKAAEGNPQFEWTQVHRGDSVFCAEVIGRREGLRDLYNCMMQAFPNLITMRIFTMRHGKLAQLLQTTIERFMR